MPLSKSNSVTVKCGWALGQKGTDLSLEAGEETIAAAGDEEELCPVGCMQSTGRPPGRTSATAEPAVAVLSSSTPPAASRAVSGSGLVKWLAYESLPFWAPQNGKDVGKLLSQVLLPKTPTK